MDLTELLKSKGFLNEVNARIDDEIIDEKISNDKINLETILNETRKTNKLLQYLLKKINNPPVNNQSVIDWFVMDQEQIHPDRYLFHSDYELWRIKRVNKVLQIFGVEYFDGKKNP